VMKKKVVREERERDLGFQRRRSSFYKHRGAVASIQGVGVLAVDPVASAWPPSCFQAARGRRWRRGKWTGL
jgi:hypothetical protein